MLEVGKTLTHYRLLDKIGQGGMGEVWKASDVRLGREVALKVLPDHLTRDTDRLERFAREAKVLASLNHSGIATLHDVDQHQDIRFIVMELVPGEDLSQRLERGPLPVDEALDVALQVARAVEAAHGQGVVHRDLKPANVKRTVDGQVKVLDFGLAKALDTETSSDDPSVSLSPTVTSAGTLAGVIMGTAAYMSPEQARGRPIDKRTDIWSFGVMLYELLTGDNPFRGDTVADSVGAVMHRDPDLEALPPTTPAGIRRLLKRCLVRDRGQRLHDIADARIEIEDAIAHPEVEAAPADVGAQSSPRSKLPWIALAVLLPLAAVLGWLIGVRDKPEALSETRRFKLVPDVEVDMPIVSPDGTRIAYLADGELRVRSLDSLESRTVDAGLGDGAEIFWSPNSRSLGAFKVPNEILRFDLDGSAPRVLTNSAEFIGNANWSDDGSIYYTQFQSGITRVPEAGGAPESFPPSHEGMIDYHGLAVLPGGRGFLTIPHLSDGQTRQIFLEKPGEEPELLFTSDSDMMQLRYASTGHLLFRRVDEPRGLWALPLSPDGARTTGDPLLVVPDLTEASVSNTGDLVFAQADLHSGEKKQQLVWLDRTGQEANRLDMALYEAGQPVVSPDGSRVALIAKGIGRPSTDPAAVWVIDLERGTGTRLTTERLIPTNPVWNADGTRVAYLEFGLAPGQAKTIAAVRADGSGGRQVLMEADIQFGLDMNPDWSIAAFMRGSMRGDKGFGIATQRPEDASFTTFVDGPSHEAIPTIHPDGNWIAYLTGDFRSLDVVIRPFPDGEGQWKVSRGGSGDAMWSADGKTLYFTQSDSPGADEGAMMAVAFDGSGSTPVLGRPQQLFTYRKGQPRVTPDGRFAYIEDGEPAEGEEALDVKGIIFVENWASRFAQTP